MSAKRLEEIFEECVTAYLEGRRSIQESLSLYPAFADELAPLLQTAVQLNESFRKVQPPARVQERGRHRFLADARARRQVRSLTRRESRGWLAGLWGQHRLGLAAAAGAVAVLAVAVTGAAMLNDGSGNGGSVQDVPSASAPPASLAVSNIQIQTTTIKYKVKSGQPVAAEEIADLQEAAKALSATAVAGDHNLAAVEQALREADAVLNDVAIAQPAVANQAQEAKDVLRGVASELGVALETLTPAPVTPTPEPVTPTPEPATPTPEPEPTPEPTPVPTEVPTPEPTPTPANPDRGLPAL
jgi:hypothetical protein